MTRFLTLAGCAFLLAGCAVEQGYEPYDASRDIELFRASFDEEYRDAYLVARLQARMVEAVDGGGGLAAALGRWEGGLEGVDPASRAPEPFSNWLAALAAEDGRAATDRPAGAARAAVRGLQSLLDEGSLEALQEDVAKRVREHDIPCFFTEARPDDLPEGLEWTTNLDAPEVGSDQARKGGTFHHYIVAFPPTLRVVGSDSNNSFRSEHWDNVEMAPVEIHPDTGEFIPGFCDRWAVSEDGRTVYYHIDPEATYSDGVPIHSQDMAMTFYLQLNDYVDNPYGKNYYREQFTHLFLYDAQTYAVRLRNPRPIAPYFAGFYASPRHFYNEVGPDFEERYNWRFRPTTGAYEIRPEGLDKGRSITLHRVEDWWARDRRYRRNRYNADRIHYAIIRDLPKMWEVFRKGELDTFPLGAPEYWYERSEVPEVFDGYIERVTFYNAWPSSGYGFYLNTYKPLLNNRDIRVGIHHACNWEKVIKVLLRGDAVRADALQQGYPLIADAPVEARAFDPAKAREYFARAGFDRQGPDGILLNAEGRRLSVAVTVVNVAARVALLNLIAEEARKAGLELRIDAVEGTTAFQRAATKQHEIVYTGWGFSPPVNDYRQFLHSENAFREDGTPKPTTNNLFSFANAEADRWSERHRRSTTMEAMTEATWELERIIHEEGIFVPAMRVPFVREAHWRWIRWPETFATAACYIPFESYVWWVDEEMKEETLEAMREGRTFPEVLAVKDAYRNGGPPPGELEPAPAPPAALEMP